MNVLTQGFRCLGTAHRALMAAATSVHAYEGAAGLHNLVIKAAHEVGPPLVENLAVIPPSGEPGCLGCFTVPRAERMRLRTCKSSTASTRCSRGEPTGDRVVMGVASAGDLLVGPGEVGPTTLAPFGARTKRPFRGASTACPRPHVAPSDRPLAVVVARRPASRIAYVRK